MVRRFFPSPHIAVDPAGGIAVLRETVIEDLVLAAVHLLLTDESIDISQIDGQVRDNSIKKVGEVVTAHPEEALAIIRTWLHQPV